MESCSTAGSRSTARGPSGSAPGAGEAGRGQGSAGVSTVDCGRTVEREDGPGWLSGAGADCVWSLGVTWAVSIAIMTMALPTRYIPTIVVGIDHSRGLLFERCWPRQLQGTALVPFGRCSVAQRAASWGRGVTQVQQTLWPYVAR